MPTRINRKIFGRRTIGAMLLLVIVLIVVSAIVVDDISIVFFILVSGGIAILSLVSIIEVDDECITIKPLLPFISKIYIVSLTDIAKIEIEYYFYFGTTSYKFLLKDNTFFETYSKLIRWERVRLVEELRKREVNVLATSIFL